MAYEASSSQSAQIELAWEAHSRPRLTRGSWLTADLREALAAKQGHRCSCCGVKMEGTGKEPTAPTFKRILPRALGGKVELDNITIACFSCNQVAGRAVRAALADTAGVLQVGRLR